MLGEFCSLCLGQEQKMRSVVTRKRESESVKEEGATVYKEL